MGGNSSTAFTYLIGTLVDLYITAIVLRMLLQWVRADFYNPVCQFLVRLTDPVVQPLRRLLPPIGRIDTASAVLAIGLEFFSVWIVSRIASNPLAVQQIAAFSLMKLMATVLWTYFFLIIAAVLLSWVGGRLRHPAVPLVFQLTEPLLAPVRRVIPPIAGIDLSPLLALIAIRFVLLLLGW